MGVYRPPVAEAVPSTFVSTFCFLHWRDQIQTAKISFGIQVFVVRGQVLIQTRRFHGYRLKPVMSPHLDCPHGKRHPAVGRGRSPTLEGPVDPVGRGDLGFLVHLCPPLVLRR